MRKFKQELADMSLDDINRGPLEIYINTEINYSQSVIKGLIH